MAATQFLGSKYKSLKSDGSINASGTVEFFTTGGTFSTYVTSYSDSALTVANSNVITLDSAGEADIWLGVTADVRVKDSSGNTIDTFLNWNPGATILVDTVYNSALNGSFENGTNAVGDPTDWVVSLYSTGTVALDTTSSAHGATSLKFTSVGAGGGYITSEDFFAVAPSAPYELSFKIISSVADVRNLVQIFWYKADQTASSTASVDAYDDSTTNPTSWTTKTYNATVPSDAYYAKLRFIGCHSSDATSGNTRYDKISFVEQILSGIKFPATQNASSDANTLDDYEEGTWTPVLTFATPGDLNVAYSIREGLYTKIGKFVHISCVIVTSTFTHTTAAGQCKITGLPYSVGGTFSLALAHFQGFTKANYTSVSALGSGSTFLLNAFGSGQSLSNVDAADMPSGGTVNLVITGSFLVL